MSTQGFTVTEAGQATIAGRTFRVEIQTIDGIAEPVTWLYGARDAAYYLRAMSGAAGVFQVVSFKSGQALRVKGNEVRVIMLGDVIETA